MARKLLCVIILLLLFNSNAFSQAKIGTVVEPHFSVFWDFYSSNDIGARVWAMGGAGVANVNNLTAMVINPAAMYFENRFQIYYEGLNKSKIRWLEKIDPGMFLKSPQVLTTFTGLGYKITEEVYTGLGYSSPRYYKLDLGMVYITTPGNPIPIGGTNPRTVLHHKQFIWQINVYLGKGIFLGSNLNYNWISADARGYYIYEPFYESKPCQLKEESDADFVNFKFGALAEIHQILNFQGPGKINLGMVYTPKKYFEPKTEWKFGSHYKEFSLGEKTLPMKLELGFKIYDLPIPLNFAGDVKYCDNSKIEYLIDRWDIHLGAEWEKSGNLAFQFGYFSRFDYRRGPDVGWLDEIGKYNQHFLTAGVRISLYDHLLQFSIRDSHLLSSGLIETTQISVGAGVGF
ncbi:MAG: hypothetical protein WBD28_04170 [Candidatus Zixiibacteriota bacterium]